MLSKADLSVNLSLINFLSFVGILPVTLKGGRLSASKSPQSIGVFVVYMILVQIHILYSAFLTVNKLNKGWREASPTVSLDYIFVPCIQMCLFNAFVNFTLHRDQVCEIFNGCMVDESDLVAAKSYFLFLPCSFIDLVIHLLPILATAFVLVFSIICALARTLPALSGTSLYCQVLAIGIDIVVTFCFTEWIYFAILLQMLFMEKASYVLQREILAAKDTVTRKNNNKRTLRSIRFSCGAMRTLQVEINMFNKSQAYIICVFRGVLTGAVVLCGLTVIEFFHFRPIIGAFNCTCIVYASLVYVTMYNNGFKLPSRCEQWKRLLSRQLGLLKNSDAINSVALDVLRMKLRSVCSRVQAVRVGNFHYLRRNSTPSFIDFNVKNIVRLMVAFRRCQ